MEVSIRDAVEHNPGRIRGPGYVHAPAAHYTTGAHPTGPALIVVIGLAE